MGSSLRKRRQGVAVFVVSCFCFNIYVLLSLVNQFYATCEQSSESDSSKDVQKLALQAFKFYSRKARQENFVDERESEMRHISNFSHLNRTDYVKCADFNKLPRARPAVKENIAGNRGITFMKISIGGQVLDVVHKEASHVFHTIGDDYKINSAKREIEYLNKLRGLPGIPRLYGYCIKEDYVAYFVERIKGKRICNDNGTSPNCSKAIHLLRTIQAHKDPHLAGLKIAYSTARLFKLLEERHLFLEDISGINLMFSPDFEVFLVDADSLIFYNQNRLFSRISCESDNECFGPQGNLWSWCSLNVKIYAKCRDLKGICVNGQCRGFDNSLHACGMAEWYLCRIIEMFHNVPRYYAPLEKICSCLRNPHPEMRCTFAHASDVLEKTLRNYEAEKVKTDREQKVS